MWSVQLSAIDKSAHRHETKSMKTVAQMFKFVKASTAKINAVQLRKFSCLISPEIVWWLCDIFNLIARRLFN